MGGGVRADRPGGDLCVRRRERKIEANGQVEPCRADVGRSRESNGGSAGVVGVRDPSISTT